MSGFFVEITDRARETSICSALYFSSFLVSFEAWMPIQGFLFGDISSLSFLFFLPHGVRVLAAWLIGWRSVAALAPGVFLSCWYAVGARVLSLKSFAVMLFSLLLVPALFAAMDQTGIGKRRNAEQNRCWKCVMFVGLISTILISIVIDIVFGRTATDTIAHIFGNMAGLIATMLMLMLFFRATAN